MAPKKRSRKSTNEASTSTASSYGVTTFLSEEASCNFSKISSLKLIKEKGFEKPNGVLQRIIMLKGWTEFYKHPEAAIDPLVREFYSNLNGEKEGTVFVRGKWVAFFGTIINNIFTWHMRMRRHLSD